MLDNYLKHTKLDMDNNSQKNYASALYTLITVFFFWFFWLQVMVFLFHSVRPTLI